MNKPLTQSEKAMYQQFVTDNRFCWACRLQPLPGEFGTDWEWTQLQNCHIIGGAGRTADRRILNRMCKAHHWLQEGHTLRHNGQPLTKLTLSNMLWLKQRFDKEHYDETFIRECRKRKNGRTDLPTPTPPENHKGIIQW